MAEATETMESAERTVYELGYHIVPTVSEDNLSEVVAEIKGVIERDGGVFLMEEFPVLTTLAYTIVKVKTGKREKHATAYFGWLKFDLETSRVIALKEELDQNEHMLRYLLITTVKEDTRAPKRVLVREEAGGGKTIGKPPRAPEKAAPISEEQLDRSIAELVVE